MLTALPECQQPSTKAYSSYLSAPNDVWSLGIILVNLTCGSNPWKRASVEDTSFKAYLRDPKFLASILPLSPELDSILRRIFECNPSKRITIPKLKELILQCPRLTSRPSPLTPPLSSICSRLQHQHHACQPLPSAMRPDRGSASARHGSGCIPHLH